MGLSARIRGAAIELLVGEGLAQAEQRIHRAAAWARRLPEGRPESRREVLELYHQLDDPYSYLLLQLMPRLVEADDALEVELHVVPGPEGALDAAPELRRDHAMRDCAEIAARYEVDFPAEPSRPSAPAVARAAAAIAGAPRTGEIDLALELTRALWRGDTQRLDALAERRGTVEDAEAILRGEAERQRRRGHYQGGMIRYAGAWYWGVDRLPHLIDDLRLAGHRVPEPLLVPRRDPPRVAAPRGEELELYFSFRSPYSYLALDRCAVLAARYAVPLRIRPVLPMVMRGLAVPFVKRLYLARDAAREARRLGIPFGKICDPLGEGVERCLALFEYAEEQDATLAFCSSAARGIWSEALDVSRDDELEIITRRAGLSWAEAAPWLDDERWRERVERNRLELRAMGLWGVPSFRIGEICLWGQDRLDRLEEHLAAWASQREGEAVGEPR